MLDRTFFSLAQGSSASAFLGSNKEKKLNISHIKQEQTEWCWAACMEMVQKFTNNAQSQCDLASAAHGQSECCKHPSSPLCNKPLAVVLIGPEWKKYGYSAPYHDGPAPFSELKSQILEYNRPIECGLKWSTGGGHAVLIVGFSDDDGEFVNVLDPWENEKTLTYSEMVAAFGRGSWKWSWIGIGQNGTV